LLATSEAAFVTAAVASVPAASVYWEDDKVEEGSADEFG
jgi:hypothetical protein